MAEETVMGEKRRSGFVFRVISASGLVFLYGFRASLVWFERCLSTGGIRLGVIEARALV
jgi:hypothetical protein